ncbi:VOC family protein [Nocardioides sp. JQ2195]|uniref:VOC family protein n=1 Tax=Nocardioides sp. JQ2195 TaxID=2592334 RepID=UPI00143EBDBD|nr:VOC family protein [Nocardioides sp. JQ2195]QIX25808.1 VOC family protein [Nocardioides sp. JQ2195]
MSLGSYKDLCIDAGDAAALGTFWAAALGLDLRLLDDGDAVLTGATEQHTIWVNTVPEPKTVKHRLHLDVRTGSVAGLVALGATVLDDTSFRWTVMADPEGGEFCAFVRDDVAATHLHELVLDCADPERQAVWWAEVLGGRIGDDAEVPYVDEIADAPFENLVLVPVPESKTAKNRVHLDLSVPEIAPLLEVGATLLAEHDDWSVLADPEGNEFCAFLRT